MDYITGVVSGITICLLLGSAYKLGQRSKRPVHRNVDEESRRKSEQMQKDFQQLMSYDVNKALGREKVT